MSRGGLLAARAETVKELTERCDAAEAEVQDLLAQRELITDRAARLSADLDDEQVAKADAQAVRAPPRPPGTHTLHAASCFRYLYPENVRDHAHRCGVGHRQAVDRLVRERDITLEYVKELADKVRRVVLALRSFATLTRWRH